MASNRKNKTKQKSKTNKKSFTEWLKYLEHNLFMQEVYKQLAKAC